MKSLLEAWTYSSNSSLESLYIDECNSLTYVARTHLPPSLKRLQIRECNNLRTLIDEEGTETRTEGTPLLLST